MAPVDALHPEGIARAVVSLPTALFVGGVSGPLNAEASALADKLDPKLSEIQVRYKLQIIYYESTRYNPSLQPWVKY